MANTLLSTRTQQEARAAPALAYIAAMLMLGTLGIFVSEARLDSVSIVFFRCVFGAAALCVYCVGKGMLVRANFQRKNLVLAVISGVLLVGNWVAFFEAIQRVGISVATVVFHVQPFLVLLIGALIFGERITSNKVGWVGLGFAGLMLATGLHLGGAALDTGYLVGILCTLTAALLYTGVALIAKAMQGMRPHLTALIHCVVGTLLLAPLVAMSPLQMGNIGAVQWAWLLGLGSIHTALVYVLVYGALPRLKNASIAVLTFIYPAAAVGFDFMVYGHALSLWQVLGLLLIALAGVGVNLDWRWQLPFVRRAS